MIKQHFPLLVATAISIFGFVMAIVELRKYAIDDRTIWVSAAALGLVFFGGRLMGLIEGRKK